MPRYEEKKIDRRNFLKLIGTAGAGMTFFGCAGMPLNLTDTRIKLDKPSAYGRSNSLTDYTSGNKSVYTTKDRRALVFDRAKDDYILTPYKNSTDESAGANKLEKISEEFEIANIGFRILRERGFFGKDIQAITSLVYCPDNREKVQRAPIGYVILAPEKILEISEGERLIREGHIEYFYNFRIKDKEKKPYEIGRGEGDSGDNGDGIGPGPGPGPGPTGGGEGVGGEGVGASGGGTSGGGAR